MVPGTVVQQTTTSAGGGALDVSTPVGLVALVAAVAGAALMAWLQVSTRPSRIRPGAATMDLRDEPPAVVDLLTGGFEVEDDAMPATVVDLAARGWFTIDEVGPDRIMLRLRQREPDDRLTAFEERVMRHVRTHATDGIVPAPVLTLGPEGVSERWFKGFTRQVTRHARDRGLCHRRWDLTHVVLAWAAVVLAGAPAGVIASAADRTPDPTGWGSVGNLLVGVSVVIAIGLAWTAGRLTRSDAQVDTAAGREAATHWLGVREFFRDSGRFEDKPAASVAVWERNLAYATAFGLAPLVQRQIPFETEHDRNAWSLATGHWRRVKVSYRAPRPGWGQAPWSVAFGGLVQAAVAGALAYAGFYVASNEIDAVSLDDDQRRLIGLVGLVVAVVMVVLAAWALAKFLLGVSDLFARRTVEGELVRRRELRTGHWLPKPIQWVLARRNTHHHGGHQRGGIRLGPNQHDSRQRTWYLAVDTGESERIRAFKVRREIYDQVRQGARIRATHSPRLGYVTEVTTLEPPRASAADEPGIAHPLAAEAAERATRVVADRVGTLSGKLAEMEQMTGPDGTPLLDQTDDEGVTLRDRLARSQEQLDAVRRDPRVARTPLLGQILDTLTGDGRADDHRAGGGDHRAGEHADHTADDRAERPADERPG